MGGRTDVRPPYSPQRSEPLTAPTPAATARLVPAPIVDPEEPVVVPTPVASRIRVTELGHPLGVAAAAERGQAEADRREVLSDPPERPHLPDQ